MTWISLKDRKPPDEYKSYLVTFVNPDHPEPWVAIDWWHPPSQSFDDTHDEDFGTVATHWMEIPEPAV